MTALQLRARLTAARHADTSPGDLCAALAVAFAVAAVVLIRREMRR